MNRSSLLLIVLLFALVALVQYSTQQTAAPFTEVEQSYILAEHNRFRGLLYKGKVTGQPMAINMVPMVWDNDLTVLAQNWANQCKFSHNPERFTTQCDYCGENMWADSSTSPTARDMTTSWFNENVNYNYNTNTCAPGQMCGHYTQIAWAATTKVGCGRALCPDTWKTIIVCNYCPGGNFYGQKPYMTGKVQQTPPF